MYGLREKAWRQASRNLAQQPHGHRVQELTAAITIQLPYFLAAVEKLYAYSGLQHSRQVQKQMAEYLQVVQKKLLLYHGARESDDYWRHSPDYLTEYLQFLRAVQMNVEDLENVLVKTTLHSKQSSDQELYGGGLINVTKGIALGIYDYIKNDWWDRSLLELALRDGVEKFTQEQFGAYRAYAQHVELQRQKAMMLWGVSTLQERIAKEILETFDAPFDEVLEFLQNNPDLLKIMLEAKSQQYEAASAKYGEAIVAMLEKDEFLRNYVDVGSVFMPEDAKKKRVIAESDYHKFLSTIVADLKAEAGGKEVTYETVSQLNNKYYRQFNDTGDLRSRDKQMVLHKAVTNYFSVVTETSAVEYGRAKQHYRHAYHDYQAAVRNGRLDSKEMMEHVMGLSDFGLIQELLRRGNVQDTVNYYEAVFKNGEDFREVDLEKYISTIRKFNRITPGGAYATDKPIEKPDIKSQQLKGIAHVREKIQKDGLKGLPKIIQSDSQAAIAVFDTLKSATMLTYGLKDVSRRFKNALSGLRQVKNDEEFLRQWREKPNDLIEPRKWNPSNGPSQMWDIRDQRLNNFIDTYPMDQMKKQAFQAMVNGTILEQLEHVERPQYEFYADKTKEEMERMYSKHSKMLLMQAAWLGTVAHHPERRRGWFGFGENSATVEQNQALSIDVTILRALAEKRGIDIEKGLKVLSELDSFTAIDDTDDAVYLHSHPDTIAEKKPFTVWNTFFKNFFKWTGVLGKKDPEAAFKSDQAKLDELFRLRKHFDDKANNTARSFVSASGGKDVGSQKNEEETGRYENSPHCRFANGKMTCYD